MGREQGRIISTRFLHWLLTGDGPFTTTAEFFRVLVALDAHAPFALLSEPLALAN